MKILNFISSPSAGGAENYVKDLSKELMRQGHQAFIGFSCRAEDVGRSKEFEEKFLKELDNAGIIYFFAGHDSRRKPWLGAWRLRRFVRAHKIDIYHTHMPYGIFFGALLSIPRVYTHHTHKPRAGKALYFLFNRLVDSYVGISTICAKNLSRYTGRAVTTILNGVDEKKFSGRSMPRTTRGDVIQGIAVGRIDKDKNYELLVSAINLLPKSIKEKLKISIAGEGPANLTQALAEEIEKRDLADTIELLGNRSDIPDLLLNSQLFLMSSASEGLPISLIEASISGLPCVVTDVGGCAEVVAACENGIIVEPGNPQALADAIQRLASDSELLKHYSCSAIRNSKLFGIEHACAAHIRLYRGLSANLGRPEPKGDINVSGNPRKDFGKQ